jgi:hypothetical protein
MVARRRKRRRGKRENDLAQPALAVDLVVSGGNGTVIFLCVRARVKIERKGEHRENRKEARETETKEEREERETREERGRFVKKEPSRR